MLLRKKPELVPKRMTLRLPADAWQRLAEIEKRALRAGMDMDVEGTLSGHLLRQIERAEKELGTASEGADQRPDPSVRETS